MKQNLIDIAKIIGVNGIVIAYINLSQVKDIVSIFLGLISIVSTLIIIRNNLRKKGNQ